MSLIYSNFIHLYTLSIRIAALFSTKAKKWVGGRKNIFSRIEAALQKDGAQQKIAWFHCASLGEFEQGRPVLEAFRGKYPDHRIFLTFFSPSGYEVLQKYDKADWIFYLPTDTKKHVREFLGLVKPDQVFFIKYEYWFNYIDELYIRHIPMYIVSGIFRKDQYFFRWYGGWARKQLKKISWFFLQDTDSLNLLMAAGIEKLCVSGDTRFDRVYAVSGMAKEFPLVTKFCSGSRVLLAGSTWPEDEKILLPMIQKEDKMKFVIAPHEVDTARINSLVSLIGGKVLKYSEAEGKDVSEFDVLVIDSIGILKHLYRYATVAYIGGGFGAGIHNILEAAAFGVPVVFGPEYRKFREARDLIALGGAVSIRNKEEFESAFLELFAGDPEICHRRAKICHDYVATRKGATDTILERI